MAHTSCIRSSRHEAVDPERVDLHLPAKYLHLPAKYLHLPAKYLHLAANVGRPFQGRREAETRSDANIRPIRTVFNSHPASCKEPVRVMPHGLLDAPRVAWVRWVRPTRTRPTRPTRSV